MEQKNDKKNIIIHQINFIKISALTCVRLARSEKAMTKKVGHELEHRALPSAAMIFDKPSEYESASFNDVALRRPRPLPI